MDTNRLGTMPEPKLSKESEHNLVFKPITLDSLSEIEPFLHRQCYRTCDFSIGGIYMWVDYFGYEYCISQDTLFIKGGEEDNLQKNTAFCRTRRQIESARILTVTERVLLPTQRPVHFVGRTRTGRTGNSTTLRLPDNRIARLGETTYTMPSTLRH